MKNSTKLLKAAGYFRRRDEYNKRQRRDITKQLGEYDFPPTMTGKILDVSPSSVVKITGQVLPRPISPAFNPNTLDAMALVAVGYEDENYINSKLIIKLIEWGNSIHTVANLTGITLQELRECLKMETGDTAA